LLHPDTADTGGVSWTANSAITTDGTQANLGANQAASLPFVPASGHVYVLSAGLNPVSGSTTNWIGMGFVTLASPPATSGGFQINGNTLQAWLLERDNRGTQSFYGGGTSNAANGPTGSSGYGAYTITLNTTGSNWTASYAQNGTTFRTITFATNPTITGISFGSYALESTNGTGPILLTSSCRWRLMPSCQDKLANVIGRPKPASSERFKTSHPE